MLRNVEEVNISPPLILQFWIWCEYIIDCDLKDARKNHVELGTQNKSRKAYLAAAGC